MLIAECLSVRLLIVQSSQCMYIPHFNCMGAVSVVLSTDYQPHGTGPTRRRLKNRACARAEMEQGPNGTGPTRRQSTCEKDRARAKWSRSSPSVIVLESEGGNKVTLHQKRVRQRRKSQTDTHTTLRSFSETLQTTALPSSPLHLVLST